MYSYCLRQASSVYPSDKIVLHNRDSNSNSILFGLCVDLNWNLFHLLSIKITNDLGYSLRNYRIKTSSR